jgi:hypothetical protein
MASGRLLSMTALAAAAMSLAAVLIWLFAIRTPSGSGITPPTSFYFAGTHAGK